MLIYQVYWNGAQEYAEYVRIIADSANIQDLSDKFLEVLKSIAEEVVFLWIFGKS